jgi:hypothetical protein
MNGQGRSLLNEQIGGRAAHTKVCAGRIVFVCVGIGRSQFTVNNPYIARPFSVLMRLRCKARINVMYDPYRIFDSK